MSIWCGYPPIGWEPESDQSTDGRRWRKVPGHFERGEVRAYAEGWSNHYPTADVEAPAAVDIAHIPTWCVPGHGDDEGVTDVPFGPWLRLNVYSPDALTWWVKDEAGNPTPAPVNGAVVLDEDAVRALRDDLTGWLNQPKVRPS